MSNKRLVVTLWSVAAVLALAAYYASRGEVVDYRDAYRPEVAKVFRPAQESAPVAREVAKVTPVASSAPVARVVPASVPTVTTPVAEPVRVRSSAPLLAQLPQADAKSRPIDPRLAKAGYVRAPQADAARRKQAAEASGIPDDRHFASACNHDHDLYLASGKPGLYVCAALNAQVGPDTDDFTETATFPNSETFKLHSRPGAQLIVYLDFTGHTTSNTPWNSPGTSFTTPPYSIDADTATYNNQEHAAIQSVWRRMAEDFAPFDVDVTTEEPNEALLLRSNNADVQYGMRVLFGPDQMDTGAGGVAFVGSFDAIRATDPIPCFVFAGQGQASVKFMSEAGSHEVGHTVGLFHDGLAGGVAEYYTGHGAGALSWAPIMGVGYSKDVVQWSKGEYANASQTQDDYAVISGFIPFATDDHGNTLAAASVLPDNVLDAGGVIRGAGDLDLIKIGCGRGALSVASKVSNQSPNLRMKLELLDVNGIVLNTVTAAGTAGNMAPAALTYTVTTKGFYYLRVSGVASGDANTGYTDYASAGRYGMTGTWPVYVPDNELPIADATGTGPTTVMLTAANLPHGAQPEITFRGLDSTDPDGVIVSYRWDFGDEAGSFSTDALTTFAYRKPGTYQARLTVTDNQGGTGSVVVPITVNWPTGTPLPSAASCIATVTADVSRTTNNTYTWSALVRAVDEYGTPVKNAEVTVGWTGALNGRAQVRTNAAGEVYFNAGRFRSSLQGDVTFTVLDVKKPEKPYDPALNNEVSDVASR
ncbi:MAG: PKD domain-containing protein [Verrucomicrobia bacterium]|nr:PKD domain-containing protein [Verrucomicrobiota bacterium]